MGKDKGASVQGLKYTHKHTHTYIYIYIYIYIYQRAYASHRHGVLQATHTAASCSAVNKNATYVSGACHRMCVALSQNPETKHHSGDR